jgi:hypothetical protein
MTTWGLAATVKAPASEILAFVAYHLDLGAHRVFIYLDDDNPQALAALKAHPKVRVFPCDAAYWDKRGGRPVKHQVRQTRNATHAYRRRAEVDWLIHMDVDEFLWPQAPVHQVLAALPDTTMCARVRPIEAASGDGTLFKGFLPAGPNRERTVARIYPKYGRYVKGGFLSHVAGKLFVRTGLDNMSVRIHNVFQGDEMNPGEIELDSMELCHAHAKSWENWIAAYRYRLDKGSYRADLAPAQPRDQGGMSLHELFQAIEAESGEAGLQQFYDEICADTPKLRQALERHGLLRLCNLDLASKKQKHFPGF